MNDSKKSKIKKTLGLTKSRRSLLDCKAYELKLDLSHMSKAKVNNLNLLFLESKWLYNHILSQKSIIDFDTKITSVSVLDKDRKPITKELSIIGSQIKQSLHSRMLDSTRALAKLKEHGFKIGRLKFKSEIKSIPLKQYGNTYRFNETKPNYVKIQGIKGYYKLNGIKQIPKNVEFANATLIHKNNNFYLALTCFVPKQVKNFKNFTGKEVGIDFGIESTITLSTGEKLKVSIPENQRSRRLRLKLSRKEGSKKKSHKSQSYLKNLGLLNKSISITNNQKKDVKNKIVSKIVNTYETVCVQDESIKQWKDGYFGKAVHNSILGGIMADLHRKSHTLKVVDKYKPTTQLCPRCFKLNKFGLEQRTYTCVCGYVMDRDTHSAQNILEIGMNRLDISKVHTEYMHYKTPMEGLTTVAFGDKSIPMKSEAHEFIRG